METIIAERRISGEEPGVTCKAAESLTQNERVALLVAAIAIGGLARQPLFLLIAGGGVFRLYTKDKPQREDWRSFAYYVIVVALLAAGAMGDPVRDDSRVRRAE
jgi:hypothetical protein